MTPEAQRIAIAETLGWKGPFHPENIAGMEGWWSQHRGTWWINPEGERVMASSVPDFLNDLNAMNRAEKAAFDGSEELWERYLDIELPPICENGETPTECATAAQRAEAFLRTLNLWKTE